MKNSVLLSLLIVATFSVAQHAHADVRLPGFYGDHMVLQQKSKISIWGWADAGETVAVSIGENSVETKADDLGKWKVELASMEASSKPVSLKVTGNNEIEIKDVLIGEVWLCSGQSNMEWTVSRSTNAEAEIAAAKYPLIRHIKIPKRPSAVPLNDVESKWELCSPGTAGSFSACGYFMARKLHEELGVPIGLVNSSWGGTRVEPWTPPVGFKKVDALAGIYESVVGRTPGSPAYNAGLKQFITSTEQWLATAKQAIVSSSPIVNPPQYPQSLKPFTKHQEPTMLYNGMIHGLVGFPIRGAIWYQGESNHTEGMMYFEKKKALIQGWRQLWGQGDFPFYFVQIAPYKYGNEDPEILANFWEAQSKVTTLPNVEMVVINDIATLNDIHPPNKQDVGLRLANLALKYDYGKSEVVAHSPRFESMETMGQSLKVNFTNVGGGLKSRDGKPLTHFEIIGNGSSGFQPALATVKGDASVVLASDKVAAPTAFRFAWHKLAEPNLSGGTGLPVGAVRGGDVPEFINTLPIGDYELVYEIDLSNLSGTIEYDVDNSAIVKSFDRVGYLVELKSRDFGEQALFATMDAFTDDVSKIGIPTVASKANFRQKVNGLEVFSSKGNVATGKIGVGNIEFWPNNYSPGNGGVVVGASDSKYDFGDSPGVPEFGYGSMQLHNFQAKETLFAINHWKNGAGADIGIGNGDGEHQDWTFSSSSSRYSSKKLRVYVRKN